MRGISGSNCDTITCTISLTEESCQYCAENHNPEGKCDVHCPPDPVKYTLQVEKECKEHFCPPQICKDYDQCSNSNKELKKEGIEKSASITTTEMIVLKSTRTVEERIQLAIPL